MTQRKLRRAVGTLAAVGVAVVTAAPAGATATGRVHVEGTQLVRAGGTPYVWHRMHQHNWASGAGSTVPDACGHTWNQPPLTDASDIASLGFNSVAIGIAWADAEPTAPVVGSTGRLRHHWNETYLHAIDQ